MMRLYEDQPSGTVDRARHLRRAASAPERRLLRAPRGAFPHLKWRHQTPAGPYFADILCVSETRAIDVDGDTHLDHDGYDTRRAMLFAREGLRTIRVADTDVMQNVEGVLTQVSFSLRAKEGARPAQPGGKDEGDRTNEKGDAAR